MLLILIASGIVILDQITKHLVSQFMSIGDSIPVLNGLFNITLVHNCGAAFGLFPNKYIFFYVFSGFTFVLIGIIYFRYARTNRFLQMILALIVGGACGNLIDRVRFHYVIDFLDFYISHYHWPAFNVADSSICVGVGLFSLFFLKHSPDTMGNT